jgi:DNA polymerase-3 subunit delta
MQALPKDKQWVNRFSGLMESLPPTTALVLFEFREQPRSNRKPSIHPIAKWIAQNKQISYTRECSIPKGAGFADWIRDRSGQLGGEISSDAARLLADWVVDDPHQADQELRKLIAYADGARMIDVEDVQQLTPYKAQSNIFGLVDAIGERKGQLAQRLLTNLLEDEEPGYAFAMVVRQFRLLLIAREAIDKNIPVTSVLNLPAFVLQKIETQARAFDDHELKQMYARLLEIDLGSKSGTIDLDVGLETIIANVAATT